MTSLTAHRKPAAEHSWAFHSAAQRSVQNIIRPLTNLMRPQSFPQVTETCHSNTKKQRSWPMEEGHLPTGQLLSFRSPVKSAQRECCLLKKHPKKTKPVLQSSLSFNKSLSIQSKLKKNPGVKPKQIQFCGGTAALGKLASP